MNKKKFSLIFLGLVLFFFLEPCALSEPWLSNRYSQNCAACHSPGRRNLEAKDRRCTLSCQGCHTNPNGGGLRNHYGFWNQQRWLRSAKGPEILKPKGIPAPTRLQKYGKMPEKVDDSNKQEWVDMGKNPPRLAVLKGIDYNEKNYDRSDRQEFIITTQDINMARMTDVDPYRTERASPWHAGADFRYFVIDGERKKTGSVNTKTDLDYQLPMALDIGVRYRPIPSNLQLVFEHRYFNSPSTTVSKSDLLWTTDGSSVNRSAYVLVDNLPYNTYAMYGMFKPLFGHSSADHTSLFNVLTTAPESATYDTTGNALSAIRANYRALTIGGSPNVPFANLHWIKPRKNNTSAAQDEASRSEGYALNIGGRFVTLGASIMFSYWSTEAKIQSQTKVKREMMGLNGGLTYKNWTFNMDFTEIERQQDEKHKGQVQTLETKYRFFREHYAVLNYATSNTARNLKKGSANDLGIGIKSFLIPGTEVEFLMVKKNTENGSGDKTKEDYFQLQTHIYF